MPQRRPCMPHVVCVEVAVFTYWTALFNCRRARGHDSAHVAK